MLLKALASFVILSLRAHVQCDDKEWTHRTVLDKNGTYVVYWSTDSDDYITFKVEVETKGYVGFGLSKTGAMAGSDIVTGWIANGVVHFQDRHGEGNFLPEIDDSQDWDLISSSENDTHTTFIFGRKLDTCDKKHDLVIDESTIRLIYAYSEEDPKSIDELQYHFGKRGSRSVMLLQPVMHDTSVDGLEHWDALSPNYTISSEDHTVYWCKILRGPTLTNKHHIVKIEPLIQPGNEGYVHHIVMYECMTLDGTDTYEMFVEHEGHKCFHPNMPDTMKRCDGVFAAWGVGGEALVFPDNVGFPLSSHPPKYYMIEMHYDNPNKDAGITDNSGLRFWYTPDLRQYDAGTWMIGSAVSPRMVIPPGQESYTISGHGHPECFGPAMPENGTNVLGVFLHSHLLGRTLRARHFRGQKELTPLAENKNYDFNYQEYRYLPEEVKVLPDDHIIVECTYNSSDRYFATFGGLSTQEEMCLAFILYYPRIERFGCMSVPTMPALVGVTGVSNDMVNMPIVEFYRSMVITNWSIVNISLMESVAMYSPHVPFCYMGNGDKTAVTSLISYPLNYEPFIPEDKCPKKAIGSRIASKFSVLTPCGHLNVISLVFLCLGTRLIRTVLQ